MKRPKIISLESFELLKDRGHAVPRDDKGYIVSFGVGKEYVVKHKESDELLTVRCTQNSPTNLKLIQPKLLHN